MVNQIEVLKQATKQNKAMDAVMHMFASRERARGQVTIRALSARMKKEGFVFPNEEYAHVLETLAKCGFGEIKRNKRANVVALINVKATLQSIGRAAIGKQDVKAFKKRAQYNHVIAKADKKEERREVLKSLGGVDQLVRTILNDTSVDADTRVQAALVLMKEKHA